MLGSRERALPDSLAYLVSSIPVRDPVSKKSKMGWRERVSSSEGLWTSTRTTAGHHVHICNPSNLTMGLDSSVPPPAFLSEPCLPLGLVPLPMKKPSLADISWPWKFWKLCFTAAIQPWLPQLHTMVSSPFRSFSQAPAQSYFARPQRFPEMVEDRSMAPFVLHFSCLQNQFSMDENAQDGCQVRVDPGLPESPSEELLCVVVWRKRKLLRPLPFTV